jgi:hypothetical protein
MTDPLVEFVRARLGYDEMVAREAMGNPDRPQAGVWTWDCRCDPDSPFSHYTCCRVEGDITIYDEGGHDGDQAHHIALHDPARVLRGVEAKRKILEEHSPGFNGRGCQGCGNDQFGDYAVRDVNECLTLRALALEFSDHPDCREEWKP